MEPGHLGVEVGEGAGGECEVAILGEHFDALRHIGGDGGPERAERAL